MFKKCLEHQNEFVVKFFELRRGAPEEIVVAIFED